MEFATLGRSDLKVSRICLGTMTFGQQVDEAGTHAILDRALASGINFIDTAEMYAVPARAETYNATEKLIGSWLAKNPQARERIILATKVTGPSRGMPWIRGGGADLSGADIIEACEASLRRLQTEVVDLYQLHWPNRNVPMFGGVYFDPAKETATTGIHAQLEALAQLVKAGKVRHIGLSNETPYGVCEFIRLAEQHGLPRIVSVQNAYSLLNRIPENGLDEALYRHQVSMLAYSPLAFGSLTGKYDLLGLADPLKPGRLAIFESMKKQRWARPDSLRAAKRYNQLARDHGLSPISLALSWCASRWQTASTIIGVTSIAQLDENLAAFGAKLSPELLAEIDQIRWEIRDPAQ
jgi:aryl-alcohol dehydrogenase-like predicted oxidoreductase